MHGKLRPFEGRESTSRLRPHRFRSQKRPKIAGATLTTLDGWIGGRRLPGPFSLPPPIPCAGLCAARRHTLASARGDRGRGGQSDDGSRSKNLASPGIDHIEALGLPRTQVVYEFEWETPGLEPLAWRRGDVVRLRKPRYISASVYKQHDPLPVRT